MKKYLSVLFALFIIASCSQTSYKSPHEKRKLEVKNTLGIPVTLTIKARYNSVVYFNETISAGETKVFPSVPLCTADPKETDNWKIEGLKDNIDPTLWKITVKP